MPFTWRINIKRNPKQPGPAIFEFDLQPTDIQIGDQIIWSNDDTVPHFPTPIDQKFVFMANQIASKSTSSAFAPNANGTITYVCSLHKGEFGTIVVGTPTLADPAPLTEPAPSATPTSTSSTTTTTTTTTPTSSTPPTSSKGGAS
jgi:hypothetical protein